MVIGRFFMIVPVLALAGSLARKQLIPISAGTFPVSGVTFVLLLIGTVLLVGALNFLPALAFGPIVEHFLMSTEQALLPPGPTLSTRSSLHHLKGVHGFDFAFPVRFQHHLAGARASISQAESCRDGQESGDVRHRGRRGLTTLDLVFVLGHHGSIGFVLQISLWLWFTVIFANFAEAMAEGRGKAQADNLAPRTHQGDRTQADARWHDAEHARRSCARATWSWWQPRRSSPPTARSSRAPRWSTNRRSPANRLPVIREAGGDRSAVTGGTSVLSDEITVRITADPGHGFMDRMICAHRRCQAAEDPNEIALSILLSALTLIFLVVVVTIKPYAAYSGVTISVTVLVALLVCLIPTTIGGLLSAIGIAGIDRLVQKNVLAMSGRAVEAAGDVDVCCWTRPAPSPWATGRPPS
jgi:hypothetical protein